MASILVEEWKSARARHGWAVGRYVIMEDHVHFFCRAELNAKQLSHFVQRWKEWTAKQILRKHPATAPIWQPEFFDHVLRSSESYSQKWAYVRENPVRAGLVQTSDDWHWQGEIENLTFL
jgi:putative transposase